MRRQQVLVAELDLLTLLCCSWYLERPLAQDEAELSSGEIAPAPITIWFGANDAVLVDHDPAGRHVPECEFRSNLETIISRLRAVAGKTEILLLTPPAVDDAARIARSQDGVAERTSEAAGRYAKICLAVTQAENVASIDTHALFNAFEGADFHALFADGLHLPNKGNRFVFSHMKSKIIEMLGDKYAFPEA